MTAKENLEVQMLQKGVGSKKDIASLLRTVGLEEAGRKKAKNFSLGMRQRLALAIALINNPDFLVLDEPTNGLDPTGIMEIRNLLLRLNQEKGTTILISTHILSELYRIYPWKALLRAGSRGCSETDYGQNLMRKMMMAYDLDHKEYARLAGFGYRMLAEAIKADLPYHISCPALLICGEKDKAGSAKSYNKKWHQREGLPLKWIKNAGHNSNTDQPDEVNRLIEKFISEIDRKGVPG